MTKDMLNYVKKAASENFNVVVKTPLNGANVLAVTDVQTFDECAVITLKVGDKLYVPYDEIAYVIDP